MSHTHRNNPQAVEALFRLMFETLWVAPYDRRRANALVTEFNLCAREAVRLLIGTDPAGCDAAVMADIHHALERLRRCVERLARARLFPPERIALSERTLARIAAEMERAAPADAAEADAERR